MPPTNKITSLCFNSEYIYIYSEMRIYAMSSRVIITISYLTCSTFLFRRNRERERVNSDNLIFCNVDEHVRWQKKYLLIFFSIKSSFNFSRFYLIFDFIIKMRRRYKNLLENLYKFCEKS